MKVALISHEGGGISSVSLGLAKSLARKNIDATIFTGSTKNEENREEGVDIVRLPIPDIPPRNIWFQLLNHKKLMGLLEGYSVIHGVSPYASVGFTFFKNNLNKPFVTTVHESHTTSREAFLRQPIYSWNLRDFGFYVIAFPLYNYSVNRMIAKSDHTVFCSQTLLNNIVKNTKVDYDRASVIYNGVDLEEIDNIDFPEDQKPSEFTMIYAGRLYWLKGIMLLLDAFKLLREKFGDIHLKIYGKGPLENRVKNFITQNKLENGISYNGYIKHQTLLTEIKKADIVVFPSLSESQSMFMLEAMACKKPLLAYDYPFSKEVITDYENGLLAEAQSVTDLRDKMELLYLDQKLRVKLGQNAYEYVEKNHNWDIQIQKYIEVYQKVSK